MKVGDKVTLIIHSADLSSEEEEHIIDEVDDKKLKLEGSNKVFYKNKKEIYRTEVGAFRFWFEIKEKENGKERKT